MPHLVGKSNPLADPAARLGVAIVVLVFVVAAALMYAGEALTRHLRRRHRAKKRRRGFRVAISHQRR